MTLCNDIPATKCFVRRQFVSDDEAIPLFIDCVIFAVHTIKNQAMTFVAMIENGACYTKLPLHAFAWKKDAPQRKLNELMVYDNFSYNNSVICYDYLKLMSSDGISASMQEYQVLGFQITKLHNFMVKYDVPCLSFVQLNRDGITKESTDAVSGSDRLIWLCTSFTIFKMKSDEEKAEDNAKNGNRKMVPIVARHGEGLEDGDYISMKMFGSIGRLEEGMTRNEIHNNAKSRSEGFEINEDFDAESDLGSV